MGQALFKCFTFVICEVLLETPLFSRICRTPMIMLKNYTLPPLISMTNVIILSCGELYSFI